MTEPSVIPPRGRALSEKERLEIMSDLERTISSSHLFKSLTDEGRRRLVESGYVLQFEPDELILQQGEEGTVMYLLLDGTVRVETVSAQGTVQLAELSHGACIGEVSVLTSGPRTATCTAIDRVKAVALEQHRIQRIVDDYPRVRQLLEAMIIGRAKDTVSKIIRRPEFGETENGKV